MDAVLIDGFLRALVALAMFFVPLFTLTAIYEWAARKHPSWFAAPKPPTPRPDLRVSAHERALLGDDWREPVAPYFAFRQPTRSDNDAE